MNNGGNIGSNKTSNIDSYSCIIMSVMILVVVVIIYKLKLEH